MSQQPPLLTPDEAQVFAAVFLLRPCLRGTLIGRLHLPVNAIDLCLASLCERGLLTILSPPMLGAIKGAERFHPSSFIPHPLYDLAAVDMHFAQLAENVIGPILDENRILRHQRQTDLEYQARQLERIRELDQNLAASDQEMRTRPHPTMGSVTIPHKQAQLMNRILIYEEALREIASSESDEGQIAANALHSQP